MIWAFHQWRWICDGHGVFPAWSSRGTSWTGWVRVSIPNGRLLLSWRTPLADCSRGLQCWSYHILPEWLELVLPLCWSLWGPARGHRTKQPLLKTTVILTCKFCCIISVKGNSLLFLSSFFFCAESTINKTVILGSAGIACWLECRTCDLKVGSSNHGRSGRRIFFSWVKFVCWLLFSVRSIPVLLQWHMKDPIHLANSAGGRLHLNSAYIPLTQGSRSGLTMPLSRHSVGTYQEMSSHVTHQGTLGQSRLSLLSHCGLILA